MTTVTKATQTASVDRLIEEDDKIRCVALVLATPDVCVTCYVLLDQIALLLVRRRLSSLDSGLRRTS